MSSTKSRESVPAVGPFGIIMGIIVVAAIGAFFIMGGPDPVPPAPIVEAPMVEQVGTITNFTSAASSTVVTVTTSSTFVTATNTASVYRRLSNLGPSAVYCSLRNGAAATIQSGLTIFASSTVEMSQDNFPYTGAISCIGHANTLVTFLER